MFGPQTPDLGRRDDKGSKGLVGVEFFESLRERSEEAGADCDVVGGGGRLEGYRRHGMSIVSQ